MKHLKLYENFGASASVIDIDKVNKIINNDRFMNSVDKALNMLPSRLKGKLLDYIGDGKYIDLGQLETIDKKYNIFNKVGNLIEKGYDNIGRIISKILPTNEEVGFLAGSLIFIVMAAAVAAGAYGAISFYKWRQRNNDDSFISFLSTYLIAFAIGIGIMAGSYYIVKPHFDELGIKEYKKVKIVVDRDSDVKKLTLIKTDDGYKVVDYDE